MAIPDHNETESASLVVHKINQVLHQQMQRDESIIILGEDILDPYGGAFKVTKGLSTAFPARVITTPISEGGIVGVGAGLALRGYKPIVEIMFGDFTSLAFDQLLNGISKFASMYNHQVTCPFILRTPMGGRRGYGPTHSQSLDKYLIGIPNITVLALSKFHDIEKIYENALRSKEPKVILENKTLYSEKVSFAPSNTIGNFQVTYSDDEYPTCRLSLTEFNSPDLTILAYGGMASIAVSCAEQLLIEEEISAEVVIPSVLTHRDCNFLKDSLCASGRLLVVEEGTLTCGYGAEVAAQVQKNFWKNLRAPVYRSACPDDIIPSAKHLEEQVLPGSVDIFKQAIELCSKSYS